VKLCSTGGSKKNRISYDGGHGILKKNSRLEQHAPPDFILIIPALDSPNKMPPAGKSSVKITRQLGYLQYQGRIHRVGYCIPLHQGEDE